MPQQQKNFDCKLQNVNLKCRFCFVESHDRNKLDLNMTVTDRFYHDTIKMRNHMSILNKIEAVVYEKEKELNTAKSSLISISSILDILVTRSSDFAHSKYSDITKQLHFLLMNAILISQAQKSYSEQLRKFFYSSDFESLQTSIHHFDSYNLQEHAR